MTVQRQSILDALKKEPVDRLAVAAELGVAPLLVDEVIAEHLTKMRYEGSGKWHLVGEVHEPVLRLVLSDAEGNPYEMLTRTPTGTWAAAGETVAVDDHNLCEALGGLIRSALDWVGEG